MQDDDDDMEENEEEEPGDDDVSIVFWSKISILQALSRSLDLL